MHDEDTVPALAAWLVARASMPLQDLASPEARAAEIERMVTILESSGTTGRWLGGLLRRATRRDGDS